MGQAEKQSPRDVEHNGSDRNNDPDLDIESLLGYNLKRAYVLVQSDFRKRLGERALGTRVFAALALVVQRPNITQSALARELGIERSGLVAMVDELEGRGYLNRVSVPKDRRVQALLATPEGEAAYRAALAEVKTHEKELFSELTQEEQDQLRALLRKFRATIEGVR